MNTPKVTDADREAAIKYASERDLGPIVLAIPIEDAFLAGKLDERAKVDELVRAAENILVHFVPGHLDHVSSSKCGTELESALKQYSGRSG